MSSGPRKDHWHLSLGSPANRIITLSWARYFIREPRIKKGFKRVPQGYQGVDPKSFMRSVHLWSQETVSSIAFSVNSKP